MLQNSPIDQAKSQLFTVQGQTLTAAQSVLDGLTGLSLETDGSVTWAAGTVIDKKFVVKEVIGSGGMGAVYRVHHNMLNKDLALKTFKAPNYSQSAWQSFQNEAKILAALKNQHVIEVYDFGFAENDLPYYAMELLNGQSLDHMLKDRGGSDLVLTIELFRQACLGLAAAHQRGILHSDVKPANLFAVENRHRDRVSHTLKVLDFGIARMLSEETMNETGQRTLFGSPLYMSPEQCRGDSLAETSDIYSLGCALYECLTGRPPFYGENALATIHMHATVPAPPLSKFLNGTAVPDRLIGLVERMLEKDTARRVGSMLIVEEELRLIGLTAQQAGPRTNSKGASPAADRQDEHDGGDDHAPRSGNLAKVALATACVCVLMGAVAGFFVLSLQPKKAKFGKSESADFASLADSVASNAIKPLPPPSVDYSAEEPAPYRVRTDDRSVRSFQFPEKAIGAMTLSFGSNSSTPAAGKQNFPENQCSRLTFIGDRTIFDRPFLLAGFAGDDLYRVNLELEPIDVPRDHVERANAVVHYLRHATGLNMLSFKGFVPDAKCRADLQSFPQITSLVLMSSTEYDGLGDARWLRDYRRLSKLRSLELANMTNITPILQKLAQGSDLNHLVLINCGLGQKDLVYINKIPHLYNLNIESNRRVNDAAIACLKGNTSLLKLKLRGCNITDSSLGVFKTMPGLDEVVVPPSVNQLRLQQLRQALANKRKINSGQTPVPRNEDVAE